MNTSITETARIYRGLRFTDSRYMDGSPEIAWKGNFRSKADAAQKDAGRGGAVSCVRLMSDGSTEVATLGWGRPWEPTAAATDEAAQSAFKKLARYL